MIGENMNELNKLKDMIDINIPIIIINEKFIVISKSKCAEKTVLDHLKYNMKDKDDFLVSDLKDFIWYRYYSIVNSIFDGAIKYCEENDIKWRY